MCFCPTVRGNYIVVKTAVEYCRNQGFWGKYLNYDLIDVISECVPKVYLFQLRFNVVLLGIPFRDNELSCSTYD